MPFQELTIVPGVNLEKTKSDNTSAISQSQYIRWKSDLPEKRGGCTLYNNSQYSGVPNALQAFQDINLNQFLGIGTTTNLYVYNASTLSSKDITPTTYVNNLPVSFSTIIGTNVVTIQDTTYQNVSIYDSIVLNTPVSVGGIVLYGYYKVFQNDGATKYQVQATLNNLPANATASITNGGVVPLFATINGSAIVTVTFPNNSYEVGNLIAFPVPTTVGGITIQGQYLVQTVVPGVSFTINTNNTATSTATAYMNGNNANITYWITQGPPIQGSGYGLGAYAAGGYGTGVNQPVATGYPYQPQSYFLDNWSDTLIASAVGGPLFTWQSSTGYRNASIMQNAPVQNNGAFVAMPQQQIMAWGSTYTGLSDPLQIRWSDISNYTSWYPTVTNQAGGYRIPTGSQIVRGIQGAAQQYWFTDIDLYVAQYVGLPFIYNFNKVSSNCGLIAPKAVAVLSGNLYWLSQKQFFTMVQGEFPQPIPCPIWDVIFQNINYNYIDNVVCGGNTQFSEVIWFYPSAASLNGVNDSYVCYNYQYNEWDFGQINRSSWINQSLLGGPIAGDNNGFIYQHETSNDNAGQPITAYFQTGYSSLTSGNDLVYVDWMIPDMKWGQYSQAPNAIVNISFNVVDYPGDTPTLYGPFPVTKQTEFIEPRFRGRYMQIIVESEDLGSFWRLGSIRYRYAQAGRR